jgi:hypothetical protein
MCNAISTPNPLHRCRRRERSALLAAAAMALLAAGCVHRQMIVRSNPPGALVYVDNYEIGTTPVATSFIYYGTREIRLVKDGYETLTVKQPIRPPWYEYPGLDFVSENVVPAELRDNRVLTYNLVPQMVVPRDQLVDQAERLRADAHAPIPGGTSHDATPLIPPPSAAPRPAVPQPGDSPSFGGWQPATP